MNWTWELPDWPNFSYDPEVLGVLEEQFRHDAGHFLGVVSHLDGDEIDRVRVDLLSDEALETSLIEGEALNRDSLQSSVRREFGLASDHRHISSAERGVSEVLVDAYDKLSDP